MAQGKKKSLVLKTAQYSKTNKLFKVRFIQKIRELKKEDKVNSRK